MALGDAAVALDRLEDFERHCVFPIRRVHGVNTIGKDLRRVNICNHSSCDEKVLAGTTTGTSGLCEAIRDTLRVVCPTERSFSLGHGIEAIGLGDLNML